MTQEEKAKAYDEALEKARMYRDNAKAVEEYAAVARYENIFPQLRENENERIRKGIIEIIKAVSGPDCDVYLDEKKQEKYLAWLEKQKEQKSAEWNEEDEMYLSQAIETLEHENYLVLADKLKSLRSQPKQEWSEEDEETLEKLHRLLIICRGEKKFIQEADYNKMDSLLKSLRPSWKPSEEHLSALLAIFNDPDNIGSQTCQLALTDLYEQLRKLI